MRYELTNETKEIEVDGTIHTLHRIKALKGFICRGCKVNVGDLGGFVETKRNLSQAQNSTAWVFDNASVYGNAKVCDNAKVYGFAKVCGDVLVYGNADISCSEDIYYDDANGITYMKGRYGNLISNVAFDDFIKTVKTSN